VGIEHRNKNIFFLSYCQRSQQAFAIRVKAGEFHAVLQIVDTPHDGLHRDFAARTRQCELELKLFMNGNISGDKHGDSVLTYVLGKARYKCLSAFYPSPDFHMHADFGAWRSPGIASLAGRCARGTNLR
jgi:hypothetical protein